MSFFFKSKSQASNQAAVSGLQLQSSTFGKAIPIVYGTARIAPNLIWYGDFQSTSHNSSAGGGGKGGVGGGGGGKGGGGSVTYTYSTAVALGLCEGPIYNTSRVYIDKNVYLTSSLGLSDFFGTYSQNPWGYLSTNHPTQALNYHGIAYTAASSYQLGNSAQLPNHNFEIIGSIYTSIGGKYDANAALVIQDLLTNSKYGAGFPSSYLGNLSVFEAYSIANGLWISPAYQEQAQCAALIADIAVACNSEFVWSNGVLNIVPFGDKSITANGYTYTAPSTVQYSLDDNDFILKSSEGPISMVRKRPADMYNSIKIECVDRNNSYNPAIVEVKDQALIDLYGLRQENKTLHLFADTTAAQMSAQLMLQRQVIRNIFTFTLDQRYILLDPMDLIAITDVSLGLIEQWVRIIDITENSDYSLTFTAEEYLNGTGNAPNYAYQESAGFNVDYNSDPGNVNTPVIFDAPVQLNTQGELETWLAVSGGTNWGGCEVYVSSDDAVYKLAGRINGNARQGILSADFNISTDPDTTENCDVNLTISRGELLSGTQNDADLGNTLCYVDGELIAYKTATLTGLYQYTLGDYIRRGMYGTTISNHLTGTQFARLDAGIFQYPYDKTQIGQTFYIKFVSFNIYGGGVQSIANVSPYTHIITGPPSPPNVTGFAVTQNGGATVFTWDAVEDFALKGYDILFGPQGEGINTATFLTQSGNGTEMTNAAVPTGNWTFYIRARDVTDRFSPVPATYDATIVTQSTVIFQEFQELDWLGTLVNFVKHYTGVLVPVGIQNSNTYTQISAPSAPSLSETSAGNLLTETYYVTVTYINQYGSETIASVESNFTVADDNVLVVSSPAILSGATGWNAYVGLTPGSGTLQNTTPYAIGSDWTQSTGGLVVGGVLPPTINSTGWEVFDIFVVDPVTSATYTSPIIDSEFDDTLRVWTTVQAAMGPEQNGQANILTYIDTWLTGEIDPNIYKLWTIGLVMIRYLKARFTLTVIPGAVPYITSFAPTSDREPKIQQVVGIVIPPGGATVTFPERYHFPPYVEAYNANPTALLITETSITDTNFLANVFDTNGTNVGGTINYRVTGE